MKRAFRLPFSRSRAQRDAAEELSFHLEGRVEEFMARGMTREDAEHEALRLFGDRATVESEVAQIDTAMSRRRALGQHLESWARDTRYAARALARQPLFAAAVIVTLGLAIGATTTIFTMFDTVLLRPIASPHLDRLAVVLNDVPSMSLRNTLVSPQEAQDLFARTDLFESATAIIGEGAISDIGGTPTRLTGAGTTGAFFSTFGVMPILGTVYDSTHSRVGQPKVVVLSHRLWRQLSGDSSIVGTTIDLSGTPSEIVGVMPAEFRYPRSALYWRPAILDERTMSPPQRRTLIAQFIGLTRDNLTRQQLAAGLDAEADRWKADGLGGEDLVTQPLVASLAGQLKPIMIAMFGAVGLVLLIACANVASMQLVRASGRAREIAVRAALGAGRGAIARQMIFESTILAMAGGALGIVLAKLSIAALRNANIVRFPMLSELRIDGFVLAFSLGVIALTAVLFGAIPVIRAGRLDVTHALRDAGRGASGGIAKHRVLRISVAVQTALTLVLLAGSALMIRSLHALLSVELGFRPAEVVSFRVQLPSSRYPLGRHRITFFDLLHERLAATPGIESVGFVTAVPFGGGMDSSPYELAGVSLLPGEPRRHANLIVTYGDYFPAMGIPIVRGRAFNRGDFTSGEYNAIVDEALVTQSFGDRDPLATTVAQGRPANIIGVARNVKHNEHGEAPKPTVYYEYTHYAWVPYMVAVVRASLPLATVTATARSIVAEIDPQLPIFDVKTVGDRVSDSLGARRLAMYALTGFGAVSLILALLGIYAVMSYIISQRTKELGIRVALGAQRSQLTRMVLLDGSMIAVAGLTVGAATFAIGARVLRTLVYGVGVFDPVSMGAAAALIAGVTLIACYLPARRAARIDPMAALREE